VLTAYTLYIVIVTRGIKPAPKQSEGATLPSDLSALVMLYAIRALLIGFALLMYAGSRKAINPNREALTLCQLFGCGYAAPGYLLCSFPFSFLFFAFPSNPMRIQTQPASNPSTPRSTPQILPIFTLTPRISPLKTAQKLFKTRAFCKKPFETHSFPQKTVRKRPLNALK